MSFTIMITIAITCVYREVEKGRERSDLNGDHHYLDFDDDDDDDDGP